jgi:hypothetical protein
MVNSVDWFNDGIIEESEQYYNETYRGKKWLQKKRLLQWL